MKTTGISLVSLGLRLIFSRSLFRKVIDTKFEYDSSKMLNGCSKKRPDIYFELIKHCIIVEIDENQHKTYEDICECARINEIVNGIGGRSVIIIRYNPDKIKNNNKIIKIDQQTRLNLLTDTIKKELTRDYNKFVVKIIQLYYDDDFDGLIESSKERTLSKPIPSMRINEIKDKYKI